MRTKVALLLFHTQKSNYIFLETGDYLGTVPNGFTWNVNSSIKGPKDNFNPKNSAPGTHNESATSRKADAKAKIIVDAKKNRKNRILSTTPTS